MIDLHSDGRIVIDGVAFYTPGSDTYRAFHQDLSTPNVLLLGRRGSGKSTAVRMHLHRLALQHPGFRYLVVRNHKTELQRTHLQFLDAEMKLLGGDYASTVGETQYSNGSVGMFAGFEKEADAQKLLGAQLDVLVVEEGTMVSWQVIVDLATTLRATKDSGRVPQLIIPTNPFGPHCLPIKRRFDDKDITQDEDPDYNPADWRLFMTTAEDNPALDFEAYDKRLKSLSSQKKAAWLFGKWALGEGSFFEQFDPAVHVITHLPEVDGRSILRHPSVAVYRAYDHGFSDDPAVCLWIAVLPSGHAIVLKEMHWKRTPIRELAQEIIGHSVDMQIAETFCDPTMDMGRRHGAQSVLEVFEINGVPMTLSVNDRSMPFVHEWLSTTIDGVPRLRFWAEGCPRLIATIPQQQPNPTNPEKMKDGNDHWVCALSFFCSSWATGYEPLPSEREPAWLKKMRDLESPNVLGNNAVRQR